MNQSLQQPRSEVRDDVDSFGPQEWRAAVLSTVGVTEDEISMFGNSDSRSMTRPPKAAAPTTGASA